MMTIKVPISNDQNELLKTLAKALGFASKSEYIRYLIKRQTELDAEKITTPSFKVVHIKKKTQQKGK